MRALAATLPLALAATLAAQSKPTIYLGQVTGATATITESANSAATIRTSTGERIYVVPATGRPGSWVVLVDETGRGGATGPGKPTEPSQPSQPSQPTSGPVVGQPVTSGGQQWYIRPDGGTRYSIKNTAGQCDGTADIGFEAAHTKWMSGNVGGQGLNLPCAFNDIRLLWQDGSYAYSPSDGNAKFPATGWLPQPGDTITIRGTQPYRVGREPGSDDYGCSPAMRALYGDSGCHRGWAGDSSTGAPPVPANITIRGENFAQCADPASRARIIGGQGVHDVFTVNAPSDNLACLDLSDQSDCAGPECKVAGEDAAGNGLVLANTAAKLTLTDLRLHGFGDFGILGPTGDGTVTTRLSLVGNASGGWSADANDGKTGTGSLLVTGYDISWNGCAEEYPLTDPLPYKSCRDQTHGGYGDGFGTATIASSPGWHVTFSHGTVHDNTQDGLDFLHLVGDGSGASVDSTTAYDNMGNQIKAGGGASSITNSTIIGNCSAMSNAIPGTPTGYNANLSDFCRGGNAPVVVSVAPGSTTILRSNTIKAASAILVDIVCGAPSCDATAAIQSTLNNLIGAANGSGTYPAGYYNMAVDLSLSDPASCNATPNHTWTEDGVVGCLVDPWADPGSLNMGNAFYQVKSGTTGGAALGFVPSGVSLAIPAWGMN